MTIADDKYTILLVDDDPHVLEMLRDLFQDDYSTLLASSGPESIELARQHDDIATVVMDIKMIGMDGITAAREIKALKTDIPIIFHTGYPGDYDEDEIDELEKPFDFVLKGEAVTRLIRSVNNAVDSYLLKANGYQFSDYAEVAYGIIGKSPRMQEVYNLIRKVASTNSKAMILGETGTGKELVARAIHFSGIGKNNRFAILNCNHKSPDLVESELFGHVRGSFTGAISDRLGLFEYADGGTVFLDEIGDLDLRTQAKLLRVLETGEYQKIGTEETRKAQVRIMCATHKNLEHMVRDSLFREDLYFRLKGVKITLPPLRERREDIPVLISKLTEKFISDQHLSQKIFEDSAIEVLMNYDWPGNVRQLKETIESLIVLAESDLILASDVIRYLGLDAPPESAANGKSLSEKVRQYERLLIMQALNQADYNISATARMLHVDRSNLRKKLRYHKIDIAKFRTTQ